MSIQIKPSYQDEKDQLLKTILNYRFLYPWSRIETQLGDQKLINDTSVELFITNSCNQRCEYCYLIKHPELYPAEFNKPELILKNLEALLKYAFVHGLQIPVYDLYTGEIWGTQLGWDVFDLLLKYRKMGLSIPTISVPSNCSFINDFNTLIKMENYIQQFAQLGTFLRFSISIDGKYIDNADRPRANKELYTDDFYDQVFSFAKIHTFYFHPMVSSHNIKYWKENFKWWKKMCEYYQLDFYQFVMMLEVRNNDWTTESIKEYCEFNNILVDDFISSYCNNDTEDFIQQVCSMMPGKIDDNRPRLEGYYPFLWCLKDSFLGCSAASTLIIRLGDLAICPCHRTSYNKYLYGHFITNENNDIIDIKAHNPYMAIKVLMANNTTTFHRCATCPFAKVCIAGCLGSQLESMHDPFLPSENVCDFFIAKYTALLKKYESLGVIDYMKSIHPQSIQYRVIEPILTMYDYVIGGKKCNGCLGTCERNI